MHFIKVTVKCKDLTKRAVVALGCQNIFLRGLKKAGVCISVWVASRQMEAEPDMSCFFSESKEELEVFNFREELEVSNSKKEVEVCNFREELEETNRSCFLCDSKEELELCDSCNLVVTCSHHGNLHR